MYIPFYVCVCAMYYCRGGKKHVVWGMHGTIAGRVFYHIILLRYSMNNMSYHAHVSYILYTCMYYYVPYCV